MQNPAEILTSLEQRADNLARVLDEERTALEQRDFDKLEQCAEEKITACEALQADWFGPSLSDKIASLPETERIACTSQHAAVLNKIAALRDANLVNGKVLNRSQNSLREILNLVSRRGSSQGALYGESGQPQHDADSGSITRV